MLIVCRNFLLVKVCGLWVHCTQCLRGANGWETDLLDPDVMVECNRTGLRESRLFAKAAPSAEDHSGPRSPQLSTEKPGVYKFAPLAHKRLKESQRPHWEGFWTCPAAAAAKSLQSCPTLCDPIDGSPPGSAIPGILQARTLEQVAISFSNAWSEKWKGSRSVVSDSWRPHGLQPTRLLRPWDFPGKSTGVGCHCLLRNMP